MTDTFGLREMKDAFTGAPFLFLLGLAGVGFYVFLCWSAFNTPEVHGEHFWQDLWTANIVPGVGGALFAFLYPFFKEDGDTGFSRYVNWAIVFAVCAGLFTGVEDGWYGFTRSTLACLVFYTLTTCLLCLIVWTYAKIADAFTT